MTSRSVCLFNFKNFCQRQLRIVSLVAGTLICLIPEPGFSAPLPYPQSSTFYSARGFKIDSSGTDWVQMAPPKSIPSLVTIYKSPLVIDGQQPALTVRVDRLKKNLSLKAYLKRWMQDYNRFGFDVLAAKNIEINSQAAFLLDILAKETRKQLRQVVFIRDKTAVILTCRDQQTSFSQTVKDCNQIIKTFAWTEASL